jgi:anti-anti-sigma factor
MRIELHEPEPEQSAPGASRSKRSANSELLSVRLEDGVLRANLNDRSLRSLDTGKLRAEIASLCRSHDSRLIVLSMRNTETLASSVLGALAQLSADLERVGGVLVLYKVPKEVAKVLRKTRLDRLIHTAKDRGAAKKKAKSLSQKSGFFRKPSAA